MSKKKPTVIQKFWERAFGQPNRSALLIRNRETKPTVHVVGGMGHASVVVIPPPPFIHISNEGAANAVFTLTALLRTSGFKAGDRAAVLAWNCPEWVVADLAIQSLGGITVPIYPHSTPEQVNYVLKDSGAKFVFSNDKLQLDKVESTLARGFLFDSVPMLLGLGSASRPFMEWFTRDALTEKNNGSASWATITGERDRLKTSFITEGSGTPAREDTATIIYTSGSTGVPKGVVLTHGNFAAACEGLLQHGFSLDPDRDVYLSYLPLAHVYERAAGEMLCTWLGIPMAFCKVEDVGEMIKLVQPTALHGVPAVWRKVKDKVDTKLSQATGLRAKLIAWAFAQKEPGLKRWLADKLVYGKIRAELGGRLRLTTSGGAPISPEIIDFYNQIGIELLQGYGLTETTGASVVNRPSGMSACSTGGCNKVGSVGQVVPGLEVRIVPVPGQEDSQDGEIQLRGEAVCKGYWNLPAETAKLFTADGWLRTGDLGRLDADGFLYITGRLKRLLKTDGGKYVAPEKIEKSFEGNPIVQYVVPVGDGKPYISALVFVNQLEAKELLLRKGVTAGGTTPADIASQPLVIEAVNAALKAANEKLERWETVKKVDIVDVEATIAGGLLTPTLKIRTEEVLKRFANRVAAFYDKGKVA